MANIDLIITASTVVLLLVALLKDLARPHLLFIAALMVLLVTGVLEPGLALSGFANEAVFTVAALFVVATGVQQTGALAFIDRVIFRQGDGVRKVAGKMMGATMALSAFLNNTPIVAMLIPHVQAWADKKGVSASKLLMPLSYATIVGGMCTVIGTSTNIIVSGMMVDAGMEPLGLFELSWIGIPAAILVFLWFMAFGLRLMPQRKVMVNNQLKAANSSETYQFDYKVPENSSLHEKTIEEAGLRALESVFLIHVQRGKHIIAVGPGFIIQSGDLLTFRGTHTEVHKVASSKGLTPAVPGGGKKAEPLPLYEAVVSDSSPLVGKTLKELEFRERFKGVVLAIQRKVEQINGAVGKTPIKAGDLLLIEAKPGFDHIYGNNNQYFYLVRRKGEGLHDYNGKSRIALAIIFCMLLAVGIGWLPMVTASLLAAIAMLLVGCVHKEQLVHAIHLPILVVIATAIGIGKAVETSGLANGIANTLFGNIESIHPVVFVLLLYLMTNLFTEFITNNAAAVLMFPLAIAIAEQVGIPIRAAAVAIAIAASASFMTPIGYQTNLMVMGAGGYKFSDYTRMGFPVTLIVMSVAVSVISWIYL
ncbi:MAG TPA: SLC13 family permease [Flavobacteriaceae bacterium]|nr:SLC13 family permease [Flavobacteriaceae bacterium]